MTVQIKLGTLTIWVLYGSKTKLFHINYFPRPFTWIHFFEWHKLELAKLEPTNLMLPNTKSVDRRDWKGFPQAK